MFRLESKGFHRAHQQPSAVRAPSGNGHAQRVQSSDQAAVAAVQVGSKHPIGGSADHYFAERQLASIRSRQDKPAFAVCDRKEILCCSIQDQALNLAASASRRVAISPDSSGSQPPRKVEASVLGRCLTSDPSTRAIKTLSVLRTNAIHAPTGDQRG